MKAIVLVLISVTNQQQSPGFEGQAVHGWSEVEPAVLKELGSAVLHHLTSLALQVTVPSCSQEGDLDTKIIIINKNQWRKSYQTSLVR